MKNFQVFLTIFIFFLIKYLNAQCDINVGPSGISKCMLLTPYYNTSQWATCLSNAYILQKTQNQFHCRYDTKYCWFQCMVELHDMDQGYVEADCACSSNQVYNFSSTCYSPDGTDCNWYPNCLQARYNCKGQSADYAILYAQKYCTLLTANYNKFSLDGRNWVEDVRKCLQVSLVPLLKPWNNHTCDQIQKYAFKTHSPCYLKPGNSSKSICELTCMDWFRTIWTIKGSFITPGSIYESINGILNVIMDCPNNSTECLNQLSDSFPSLPIKIILETNVKTSKRSTINFSFNKNELSTIISNSISSSLNWNASILDWLTIVRQNTTKNNQITAVIWVLSRTEVDKNITANKSNILKETQNKLNNLYNKLNININGYNFTSKEIVSCADLKCEKSNMIFPNVNSIANNFSKTFNNVKLNLILIIFFIKKYIDL